MFGIFEAEKEAEAKFRDTVIGFETIILTFAKEKNTDVLSVHGDYLEYLECNIV